MNIARPLSRLVSISTTTTITLPKKPLLTSITSPFTSTQSHHSFSTMSPSAAPSNNDESTLVTPGGDVKVSGTTELLRSILDANETYAAAFAQADPHLLKKLQKGQSPKIFWLGCSDSRVSAELSTGVAPGSIFVHRNIAQCFHPGDPSASAALAYAVHVLKVEAIIVCGHTGCGGVRAGMQAALDGEVEPRPMEGSVADVIQKWIAPIKSLASTQLSSKHGASAADPLDTHSLAHLTDTHVENTVKNVIDSPIVQEAWNAGMELSVHGWVYHVGSARLRDLDVGYKGVGERADSLSRPSTYADSEPKED